MNLSSIPRKKIANTKLKLMSNENKTKKKKFQNSHTYSLNKLSGLVQSIKTFDPSSLWLTATDITQECQVPLGRKGHHRLSFSVLDV